MRNQFVGIALLMSLATPIVAQDREIPPRNLRFLAVGDVPPFRQEIRNGVRYELDAPVGSLPPRELELQHEGGKAGAFTLILGRPSSKIELPGIETTVALREGGQLWHAAKLPEGGDFLSVLWRSPRTGKWDKAFSLLVPDGDSFRAGEVRFVNVSPVPIRVQIEGEDPFEVAPGKSSQITLPKLSGNATRVVYRDEGGKWRRLWSSALTQNRGERSTVVVYLADGEQPRSPLKLLSIREKVTPPMPKTP